MMIYNSELKRLKLVNKLVKDQDHNLTEKKIMVKKDKTKTYIIYHLNFKT